MSELDFWLLMTVLSFATSIISGVLGMAGGLLLLSALLSKLDPLIAIPVHGVVQLVSNFSRALLLRKHVSLRAVARFSFPLLPAGALGLSVQRALPAAAGRVAIGLFVMAATFAPGKLRPGIRNAERALPVGGVLVGFSSTLVGATGPLLAPFILALGLGPQATIGTLAACQTFQHASKILLFGVSGFDFSRYGLPALALSVSAVAGTAVGTRLLDRIPERQFRTVVTVVLTALAIELVVAGSLELLR